MTEPKRTPHRQIQAALRIGYRVAANLSAAGYQLGEPIPEAFARDVELSQLGRLRTGVSLPAGGEKRSCTQNDAVPRRDRSANMFPCIDIGALHCTPAPQ